jgi:hypothetical protein
MPNQYHSNNTQGRRPGESIWTAGGSRLARHNLYDGSRPERSLQLATRQTSAVRQMTNIAEPRLAGGVRDPIRNDAVIRRTPGPLMNGAPPLTPASATHRPAEPSPSGSLRIAFRTVSTRTQVIELRPTRPTWRTDRTQPTAHPGIESPKRPNDQFMSPPSLSGRYSRTKSMNANLGRSS